MAKYTSGATLGVTRQQMLVTQFLFEGKTPDEVARLCFDVRAEDGVSVDEDKVKKARAKVRCWMRNPKFSEVYDALLKELIAPMYASAARKIGEQISDPNGWLANKAANDVLTRFSDAMLGKDSNEITVKVEGMPKLGTPDEAE